MLRVLVYEIDFLLCQCCCFVVWLCLIVMCALFSWSVFLDVFVFCVLVFVLVDL